MFSGSDRFNAQFNPEDYSHIPLMKEKLELFLTLNLFLKYYQSVPESIKYILDKNNALLCAVFGFKIKGKNAFLNFLSEFSNNQEDTKYTINKYSLILFLLTSFELMVPDSKLYRLEKLFPF